ncbi:hypothetical protein SALBM135S_06352 [Streptomyces alboniger]
MRWAPYPPLAQNTAATDGSHHACSRSRARAASVPAR